MSKKAFITIIKYAFKHGDYQYAQSFCALIDKIHDCFRTNWQTFSVLPVPQKTDMKNV